MRPYFLHCLTVATFLLLGCSSIAFSASVNIASSGSGAYSVQGNAMDGVAGIELNLTYDSLSLASPTVTQGNLVSGAVFAANTTIPGAIKIAIISGRPFSGSGQIASINFAKQGGSGGITLVKSSMIDSKGAPVTSQADVSGGSPSAGGVLSATAGLPFQAPAPAQTATVGSSMPSVLGTVTMPSDVQTRKDTKLPDTTGAPAQFTEPVATRPVEPPAEVKPVSDPKKPEKIKMTSYKGILENFRAHEGEKSPAILIALFRKEIAPTIRQEPAVVLSDGKTPLKLLVKLDGAADKSPNFALSGAKLISLNNDASTWIIEALPHTGIARASLTILTDSDIIEFPLTLAPPVEGVSPAEADFVVFLKDSGAATPKRDLNGDGKHDYLDDFIYTANYLMKMEAAGKAKK